MSQPPRKHLARVRMLSRPGRAAPGLRITHVKSIKPPDPEASKKQEEERLRAQLQKEIVSRSRQCAYKDYECLLPVMSGRHYCGRHILKDPTAPYKQCVHTFGNGERCSQPAPDNKDHRERDLGAYKDYECLLPVMAGRHYCGRHILKDPTAPYKQCVHTFGNGERCSQPAPDNKDHRERDLGLCFEHARASLHARQRAAAPPPPATTTETLLNQLQHYVRPERPRTTSCASSVSVVSDHDPQDPAIPSAVDPFKQIDATAVNAQYSASIMECASASDSDCDSVTLGPDGTIRECDSDSDEAPCETQPLWRAGVYTAEEAVSEARSALVSLQQAYTRQLSRLRVLLQTHRGNYLRALKAEKETYCSINAQARSGPLTVRERRQLRKLKAYAAHHRRHGVDAVLARKLTHKRAKQGTEPSNRPIPSQSRCTYTEESVRCGNPVLPASKHCLKHILHDSNQVLFVPCSSARGVGACREAVPLLPAAPLCRYHAPVPAHQVFHMRKDESKDGSESEVTSDASEPGPSEPVLSEPMLSEIPARSAITSAALQDIMFQ